MLTCKTLKVRERLFYSIMPNNVNGLGVKDFFVRYIYNLPSTKPVLSVVEMLSVTMFYIYLSFII